MAAGARDAHTPSLRSANTPCAARAPSRYTNRGAARRYRTGHGGGAAGGGRYAIAGPPAPPCPETDAASRAPALAVRCRRWCLQTPSVTDAAPSRSSPRCRLQVDLGRWRRRWAAAPSRSSPRCRRSGSMPGSRSRDRGPVTGGANDGTASPPGEWRSRPGIARGHPERVPRPMRRWRAMRRTIPRTTGRPARWCRPLSSRVIVPSHCAEPGVGLLGARTPAAAPGARESGKR